MQHASQRSDGWTPKRQLRFLEILLSRSVTKAAGAAGMSRESAHRLRKRDPRGFFVLAWRRALGAGRATLTRVEVDEGHIPTIRRACSPEGTNVRPTLPHRQRRDVSRIEIRPSSV